MKCYMHKIYLTECLFQSYLLFIQLYAEFQEAMAQLVIKSLDLLLLNTDDTFFV